MALVCGAHCTINQWNRIGIFLWCMIKHHFGLNSMDLKNYGFLIGGFHVHPVDFELMSSPYTLLLLGNEVQFELEFIGLKSRDLGQLKPSHVGSSK